MSKLIWTPDAYFRNGRRSHIHDTTQKNLLLRLKPTGAVHLSMRITVVAKCYLDLKRFPMDTHICKLQLSSYAYPDNEIEYHWSWPHRVCNKELCLMNTGAQHNCSVCIHASARRLIQFRLIDWTYRHIDVFNPALGQNQSVLEISFHVQRHIGYFVVQTYLPCILVVILSQVSFWINKEATPARCVFGLMSVLSLVTLSISERQSIPRVGYATAMDIFITGCFLFCFSSLIEFAAVNYLTVTRPRYVLKQIQDGSDITEFFPQRFFKTALSERNT